MYIWHGTVVSSRFAVVRLNLYLISDTQYTCDYVCTLQITIGHCLVMYNYNT